MSQMNRREFLAGAAAVGASLCARDAAHGFETRSAATTRPAIAIRPAVSDTVTLGKTGIKTSRLAIGTGTDGGSQQRGIGLDGLNRVLRHGLDNGVHWWDTADMYKTHTMLAPTLKELKRDRVVITSKTRAKDAAGVRADLERFRKELDTDYIDIVLLHCMEDPQWPEKMKGPMDVLSEAKQKGWIRAHGTSCHTLGALQAAADRPWVEVDLARFNPFATIMDVPKADEINKVEETLAKMHARGKAVYAMKLIGNGKFKGEQIDQSLRFALSKPFITGLNIGFTNPGQLDDITRRIERINAG